VIIVKLILLGRPTEVEGYRMLLSFFTTRPLLCQTVQRSPVKSISEVVSWTI